jgi:hypothetical protein
VPVKAAAEEVEEEDEEENDCDLINEIYNMN